MLSTDKNSYILPTRMPTMKREQLSGARYASLAWYGGGVCSPVIATGGMLLDEERCMARRADTLISSRCVVEHRLGWPVHAAKKGVEEAAYRTIPFPRDRHHMGNACVWGGRGRWYGNSWRLFPSLNAQYYSYRVTKYINYGCLHTNP